MQLDHIVGGFVAHVADKQRELRIELAEIVCIEQRLPLQA